MASVDLREKPCKAPHKLRLSSYLENFMELTKPSAGFIPRNLGRGRNLSRVRYTT